MHATEAVRGMLLNASDKISEIVQNREKAKLAILKELADREMNQFELDDTIQAKYYNKNFRTFPFIEVLKEEELIEEKEGKYRIIHKSGFLKMLIRNQDEIKKILALDFGKGDLVGQLNEQEKYILGKVMTFGDSATISALYDSIFDDIDHGDGPFAGYSRSSYGKKRAPEITNNLIERGFLKTNGSLSIPDRVLSDFVLKNPGELLLLLKPMGEKTKRLIKENRELSSKIDLLKTRIEKLDPTTLLEKIAIPRQMRDYIDKAIFRIDEGSYSEAIMNCYRVSETFTKILFDFLYSDLKDKRIKHEDKLKKIWNDEKKEKKKYPGIRPIASLFAVILWYRNKMGAHMEMRPTKEAATICLSCLIQALIEFKRLEIKIEDH